MTKLTFNLSKNEFTKLKQEAKIQGRTVTDALRKAISLELFLSKQERCGTKIILDEGGTIQRLLRL